MGDLLIQRLPRGLQNLLSLQGPATPQKLSEAIHGELELTQFYGLTQLQSGVVSNGAAAEGAAVTLQLPASWCVLFAAASIFGKTATMTALTGSLALNRTSGINTTLLNQNFSPFGATETGNVALPFWAPYPILCPPNSQVIGQANILGTDATVAVTVTAEFGVLG